MRKKQRLERWTVGTLFTLFGLLSSCSQAKIESGRLPDEKSPMTFTTELDGPTVEGSTSKTTVNGFWAGNEEVAIQIGNDVKKYTADINGVLSASAGVEPFYWKQAHTKSASAWYSNVYSTTQPTVFTVEADQSTTGYQKSDLIYAWKNIFTYDNSLPFKHLPVKVVVNLTNGKGVTESEVQDATVSIIGQSLTSGTVNGSWVVKKVASGSNDITPNVLTTATDGYKKTVQALVVPQNNTTIARFIKVTVGSKEFYYSTATNFTAGEQHTYNITVKEVEIIVTTSGAAAWTGTTTNLTSKTTKPGFSATDLKLGDYYYSDGTYSDGGYRAYTDNTDATLPIMPVLTGASGDRTVIGIVLKAGKDADGEYKDDCIYKTKNNSADIPTISGYVLALYDAKDENGSTSIAWGSSGISVIHPDMDRTSNLGFYGYKSTNAIKAFAAEKSWDLKTAYPATYYATMGYETSYPAPANSSGWFLPSSAQILYLYQKRVLLSNFVRRVTGGNTYIWAQNTYLSSSEYQTDATDKVYAVQFYSGYITSKYKDSEDFVRSLLAF